MNEHVKYPDHLNQLSTSSNRNRLFSDSLKGKRSHSNCNYNLEKKNEENTSLFILICFSVVA